MNKSFSTLLLAMGFINIASASAQTADVNSGSDVIVHVADIRTPAEGFEFSWQNEIRLTHVMNHALKQAQQRGEIESVYWPASRLVDHDGNAALHARQRQVAEELAHIAEYWRHRNDDDRVRLAEQLRDQVLNWQLAYQPFRALNFERARQTLDANPLIAPGRYSLLFAERPTAFAVYGASGQRRMLLQSGQTVRNYVLALKKEDLLLPGFDRSSVQLLAPGGQVRNVNWAYYNASDDEVRPGDLIWVAPAKGFFPTEYRHLEQDLPELLRHWVGDESYAGAPALDSAQARTEAIPSYYNWQRQDLTPARNHYGSTGLMQTGTARMAPEGETLLMYSDTDEYRRYTVSMQVLPWLEASAFYTRIPNRLYSNRPGFSGTNILTDKGFDAKVRLWQESFWLPQVAVGFQDFAGTGLFSGEYLVANKRWGSFDFSLGLGFGRLGSRDQVSNPFCEVADRFCDRSTNTVGTGSQLDFDRYFGGPASFFGGVEYQTPWDPLRVMVEYDGNDYSLDRAGVPIDGSTPWNIGLNYRVFDWLDTSVSYERGDTFMFNIVLRTNMNTLNQIRVDRPRVTPDVPQIEVADVDWQEVSHDISRSRTISAARIKQMDESTVRVVGHPWRYRDYNEMYDRASRVLADNLPESIENYEFEILSANQPLLLTSVNAADFRSRINNEDYGKSTDETAELFERTAPDTDDAGEWRYDFERTNRIGYGLNPFFKQEFGSPETFHFYQLGVKAFAQSWVTDNIHIFGELGINIANNYDRFLFDRDPFNYPLPKVRSDFRLHATNDVWVDRLQASYYRRLSENTYGMLYGGYLERFFSGVGGEFLYRQVDSPWAFSFNINRLRQRDYEGWLGTMDYEVTMGHASVYYQMPWLKDSMLRLDVGRFLAGDDGVGVTFARRFDSGVVVSAYASFTDVSSEDYGEGSFTHGFQISIPFDLIGVNPTRQRVGLSWSPMSRDGGQPLWRHTSLYGITDDRAPFWNR